MVPEDAVAWCDSEAVSQILSNLLDNAIKYSHPGGRIVIGAWTRDAFVELFVRDTGIGIPKDKQKLIFEAFAQADGSMTRRFGGTGLGLAIAQKIMEEHGGKLIAGNNLEGGACMIAKFPVPPEGD